MTEKHPQHPALRSCNKLNRKFRIQNVCCSSTSLKVCHSLSCFLPELLTDRSKATEVDFRGFLTTKVSTTWLRLFVVLGSGRVWGNGHYLSTLKLDTQEVCKEVILIDDPNDPSLSPPPRPLSAPSALYILPGPLLAHSDLMPMVRRRRKLEMDVDQSRSCRQSEVFSG